MDRSLDPDLLHLALGESPNLPSVDELVRLLADLEIGLFAGWEPERSPELLRAAWYLHGIASHDLFAETYGAERQRRAFQVSAHFFDLQIDTAEDEAQRRRFLFASQVGYVRSGLEPNANALFRRWHPTAPTDLADTDEVPLTLGCLLLGGKYPAVRRLSRKILGSAASIARNAELGGFHGTMFEAELYLCQGSASLVEYLESGDETRLSSAREQLRASATSTAGGSDLDARWVAAHLLHVSGDFQAASVWTVLPDDMPPGVARAFVLGKPRVSTFWPPQLAGLKNLPASITAPSVKRAVMALPTSAGKSLLAQVVAAVHLARGTSGVCYVAPTRSLCREVQTSFGNRLRFIASEGGGRHRFDVMTPERLHASLRTDPARVLDEYGLFIFDEMQSVGDGSRGWVLESALSLLHAATRTTSHRIVAISPTSGNLAQIAAWTGSDQLGQIVLQEAWRAPRRLNAVYSPEPKWSEAQEEPRRSADWPIRRMAPMYGYIHLLLAGTRDQKSLHITHPVGTLQLRVNRDGTSQEREKVTPQYRMNLPMITHLGRAGSVLILVGTRASCSRYATALAAELGEDRRVPLDLISLVAGKLGDDHPLAGALASGVAYHHGALPWDVQAAIEEAVRLGQVNYLVATTTLTEGVNLPVRSVVIAETGFHDGQHYQRVITGSKLLNAVGRAGRALAETEGWAVLADRNCPEGEFCGVGEAADELKIESYLASAEALRHLQDLESQLSSGEDLLVSATGAAADFVSFNWFLMHACEQLRSQQCAPESHEVLESTLAWRQLADGVRQRWLQVGQAAQAAYERADSGQRRRWVESGLPLSTARELEILAERVAELPELPDATADPLRCLKILEEDGVVSRLLRLPAAPAVSLFSARRGRGRHIVDVDIIDLLHDWLGGHEFAELAANHLSEVVDPDYRDEQLADVVSSVFIDYLPWVLGVLLQWARELGRGSSEPHTVGDLLRQLIDGGGIVPFDLVTFLEGQEKYFALPAMIHYGVNSEPALTLARAGVSSRSLAVRIGNVYQEDQDAEDLGLREWLCLLGLDGWIQRFDVSVLAARELVRFSRIETSTLLGDVLNEKEHRMPLEATDAVAAERSVSFRAAGSGEGVSRVGIADGDDIVALVPLMYQHDIERLMELDLPLHLVTKESEDGLALSLLLNRRALITDALDQTVQQARPSHLEG